MSDESELLRDKGRAEHLAWIRFKTLLGCLTADGPPDVQNLPEPVMPGMESTLQDALDAINEITIHDGQQPFGWPLRQDVREWLMIPVKGGDGDWTPRSMQIESELLAVEQNAPRQIDLVALWEQVPRATH